MIPPPPDTPPTFALMRERPLIPLPWDLAVDDVSCRAKSGLARRAARRVRCRWLRERHEVESYRSATQFWRCKIFRVGELIGDDRFNGPANAPPQSWDDPALLEIVRRVVETFHPERVYLFGAQARGDFGPHSDYDLMVVVARSREPEYRRAQRAHRLIWGLGVAADILVWTRDAFDSRTHLRASLPSTILREGKLLYVA
jgi:predicted nucleotidyltransferase